MFGVIQKIQSAFQPKDLPPNLGWMNTLSDMSELEVFAETTAQLAKVEFTQAKHLKNNIDLVLEIDEKTYLGVKKITHKYLILIRNNRDLQNEVQSALFAYHQGLYTAYTQFLACYQNQAKLDLGEEKFNLILARLLNAAFTMAKWRYFDDQPAPVGMWSEVHKIIKTAENLAIMNKNLFLYNFQIKETSIATILKRGFMVDTLQKSNFSRLQIELTEQVLKIWSTNPLIVKQYKQDRYHFFIALEGDRGPERVRVVEKFAEHRYWKTTRLADLIEAYLCAVDTGKPVADFGLEQAAPVSVVVKLFKKLRTEWCVEGYARQRRKEARNANHKLLNVSHGLHDVYQRLYALQLQAPKVAASTGDFSFELKSPMQSKNQLASFKKTGAIASENWWLVDESSNGFAVDLGKKVSNWVEVGKLVGYHSVGDDETFYIAEIKSIRKQKDGTYRAGMQLIAAHGVALQMLRVDKAETYAMNGYHVEEYAGVASHFKTSEAILVNGEGAAKRSLIMPRSEYKRAAEYRMNIDGEDKVLSLGRILSKQRDWLHVALLV